MSSGAGLSVDAQIRYMIQWFEEWSELQRQDFLPILAEKMAAEGEYVNGIVNSMNSIDCQDKPMNLFQCRVKLFNEWFATWTNEDRNRLVERISSLDAEFGKKLQEEITGNKQVIDNDQEAALPTTEEQNGHLENEQNAEESVEVENQEVLSDQNEVGQVLLNENSIQIEITAE